VTVYDAAVRPIQVSAVAGRGYPGVMAAAPLTDVHEDPEDPRVILERLPVREHELFLGQYSEAVEAASFVLPGETTSTTTFMREAGSGRTSFGAQSNNAASGLRMVAAGTSHSTTSKSLLVSRHVPGLRSICASAAASSIAATRVAAA
jgi:hypothetical protein